MSPVIHPGCVTRNFIISKRVGFPRALNITTNRSSSVPEISSVQQGSRGMNFSEYSCVAFVIITNRYIAFLRYYNTAPNFVKNLTQILFNQSLETGNHACTRVPLSTDEPNSHFPPNSSALAYSPSLHPQPTPRPNFL